ncbi:MAG: HNH endonuclease signature motif containing protein [bacterium]|nr:HNH endonuclease signature motif containing protein [bacterium]MDE0416277.1 HNH endonuclease signature motif containing protein [bacterium]
MIRRRMSPERRSRIIAEYGGMCGICGRTIADDDEYEIDHAIPLGLGGTDDDSNLQPVHIECHRAKTYGGRLTRGDVREIAKAKRIARKRQSTRPDRPPRHRDLVRSVDGTVSVRDGSEARMR